LYRVPHRLESSWASRRTADRAQSTTEVTCSRGGRSTAVGVQYLGVSSPRRSAEQQEEADPYEFADTDRAPPTSAKERRRAGTTHNAFAYAPSMYYAKTKPLHVVQHERRQAQREQRGESPIF
jgi:hypothetical protein